MPLLFFWVFCLYKSGFFIKFTLEDKPMHKKIDIEPILPLIRKASRYLGTEVNTRHKNWHECDTKVALIFPDLYEIGMSHLGLHILYHILNDIPFILADRCYAPDTDLEKILFKRNIPLWALESRMPLRAFDFLAFTLPYELCYTNIITILKLSNIPILSKERDESFPFILAGGSCSIHTEPVCEVFDAVLIGDGEEAVPKIVLTVRQWKKSKGSKEELFRELAKIEGVYIPSLYEPIYEGDRFLGVEPKRSWLPNRIKRTIIPDLSKAPFPTKPIVPYLQIVHDRLGVEIARGCTRSCRFCQAGVEYRPVRERPARQVLELVEKGLRNSGFEDISLLSLSTGDYSCLYPLIKSLMDTYVPKKIAVSLPSIRVGTLTPQIMTQIKRVRKTGFTMAPEAGSERLRQVINKGITEDDLIFTAQMAFEMGWLAVKLYFMIGLPTETQEDIIEIAELSHRVLGVKAKRKRGRQVTISVGTFVPKPHTPFQWERQISIEESWQRLDLIKRHLKARGLKLRWHDPKQSYLEGVFSRGDRRLLSLIVKCWEKGARFDAWGDYFNLSLYRDTAKELGIDLDFYLKERMQDGTLFWDHIDCGVRRSYLKKELKKAIDRVPTLDCRKNECQGCGVCDFKKIKPVTWPSDLVEDFSKEEKDVTEDINKDTIYWYAAYFFKLYELRFLSHLEIVRTFQRAINRAHIPISYTQGFHPKPRISFGPPVPVSTEAIKEPICFGLSKKLDEKGFLNSLNKELPHGIKLIDIRATKEPKKFIKDTGISRYLISFSSILKDRPFTRLKEGLSRFLEKQSFVLKVKRKGKERCIDIKEAVTALLFNKDDIKEVLLEDIKYLPDFWLNTLERNEVIYLELDFSSGAQLKAYEVISGILGLLKEEEALLRVLRLSSKG